MFHVLTLACTHEPQTEVCPAREIPLSHLIDTTDPHKGHQLGVYAETRREDQAATPQVGSETQAAKRQRAKQDRHYHNSAGNGVPQGGEGQHSAPHCNSKAHDDKRLPHEAHQNVDITERWIEESAEAPHGGTETLAAKTHRTQHD